MVVNSHLTAQQAGALAGLEGLQAVAWGSPAPQGTRVGRGFAPGGAGRPAGAAGHGGGHSASQRPERRKTESEQESRNKGPAPEASGSPKAGEWERWGVRTTGSNGRSPKPRPGDCLPHAAGRPHLWAFPGPRRPQVPGPLHTLASPPAENSSAASGPALGSGGADDSLCWSALGRCSPAVKAVLPRGGSAPGSRREQPREVYTYMCRHVNVTSHVIACLASAFRKALGV